MPANCLVAGMARSYECPAIFLSLPVFQLSSG